MLVCKSAEQEGSCTTLQAACERGITPAQADSVLVSLPRDEGCSMHAGRDGCAPAAAARLSKVGSCWKSKLPLHHGADRLCPSDASPHAKVLFWSPQGNTILGMVYSSRRMKRCSHLGFAHLRPLVEEASVAAEDTKEPTSTFLTQDAHLWLFSNNRGRGKRKQGQQPAGPGSELMAQEGTPQIQQIKGGIQQINLTHTPLRQLKPPGALTPLLADLTSSDTTPVPPSLGSRAQPCSD